jgi:hypothetical protein
MSDFGPNHQKNGFDHWFRRKYLLTYAVYTDNPYPLPFGASGQTLVEGGRWAWRIDLDSEEDFQDYVDRLKRDLIPFQPEVGRKNAWWVRWIEPTEQHSISAVLFSRIFKFALAVFLIITLPIQLVWRMVVGLVFKM